MAAPRLTTTVGATSIANPESGALRYDDAVRLMCRLTGALLASTTGYEFSGLDYCVALSAVCPNAIALEKCAWAPRLTAGQEQHNRAVFLAAVDTLGLDTFPAGVTPLTLDTTAECIHRHVNVQMWLRRLAEAYTVDPAFDPLEVRRRHALPAAPCPLSTRHMQRAIIAGAAAATPEAVADPATPVGLDAALARAQCPVDDTAHGVATASMPGDLAGVLKELQQLRACKAEVETAVVTMLAQDARLDFGRLERIVARHKTDTTRS